MSKSIDKAEPFARYGKLIIIDSTSHVGGKTLLMMHETYNRLVT